VKRLHRFIILSFLGPLVLTFFITTFILLMQFLWKWIDDLAGKGLSISVIAELLLYVSASLVPMALPLAILLSSIMTFGNLGENYELTALKSSGISLQRIMSPLIFFVIGISLLAFFFSNNVMPYANLKMQSLLYDVTQKRPEFNIREGIFYNGIDNYSIKIGHRDNRTNLLHDIKIYDHTEARGNLNVTTADSGYMKMTADSNLVFTLMNGYMYSELTTDRNTRIKKSYPARRDHFDKQDIVFSLSGFNLSRTDENLFKGGYKMMNLKQLTQTTDSLYTEYNAAKKQFYKEVVVTNYFRTDPVYKKTLFKDTVVLHRARLKSLNMDSLYESFDMQGKRTLITQALNLARATSGHIVAQKDNFLNKTRKIRRHEIEWHRKFTLSFACLVFFFIGAPLGAIIRRGGLGMPVVVSIVFFVIYYVVSISGEKFARESVMPAFEGMWLSSFLLLPLGVFLTYKATSDSAVLNIDTYLIFFRKVAKFLRLNEIFETS
jgi:lipopolysaccharide export system permease protein